MQLQSIVRQKTGADNRFTIFPSTVNIAYSHKEVIYFINTILESTGY